MIRRLTPPPEPTFLGVPLELRLRVYAHMLELPAHDHIALLCTCRQIYSEGQAKFSKRPLHCRNQDELQLFAMQHTPETLQNITALVLRFEEVSPAAMTPALSLLVRGFPLTTEEHPYYREVYKVTSSLLQMPNVRHLSLLVPSNPLDKPPSRDFFELVFAWIGKRYTQIETLHLGIEHSSLTFLRTLPHLRALHFSGFSITTPAEPSLIFAAMPALSELTVSGPPRRRSRTSTITPNNFVSAHRFVTQSLTAEVLRSMRPLRKFSIQDLAGAGCPELSAQTEEIFAALASRHRSSLVELNISSERVPDPDIQAVLKRTIPSLGGRAERERERKGRAAGLDCWWLGEAYTGTFGRVTRETGLKIDGVYLIDLSVSLGAAGDFLWREDC